MCAFLVVAKVSMGIISIACRIPLLPPKGTLYLTDNVRLPLSDCVVWFVVCTAMKLGIHLLLPLLATFVAAITPEDAEASFTTLQQWYNESIGLWIPSTGW